MSDHFQADVDTVDTPVVDTLRGPVETRSSGLTKREHHRLDTIQRMIDRLEHRAADPTFRKSHWMMSELSALSWAMRILRGDPDRPLGAAIRDERTRERRT